MASGRVARTLVVFAAIATPAYLARAAQSRQPTTTKLAFDVASVRQAPDGGKPKANLAIGPGDVWGPSGGELSAKNFSLLMYLGFAYRMKDYQFAAVQAKLPEWALTQRFDIEARTDNPNPTKDQMREMMRSLLAERFGLAVHYALRKVPVYALIVVKPGSMGPKLRKHPADSPCPTFSPLSKTAEGNPVTTLPDAGPDGFPTFCGGILDVPASAQDRYSFGARDVPMSIIAGSFSSSGNLGRPVVDETGLPGNYDFVLDYTPDSRPNAAVDSGGPSFEQALKEQLGLKLEKQDGDVEFLVLDHVERPSGN